MELIQTLKATISGDDDRGVSPVIGVILMVAITVILAAVIATFVLGLGEQVSQTAPQANFDMETSVNSGTDRLTVSHDGGGTIDRENIAINVDGTQVYEGTSSGSNAPADFSVGSSDFSTEIQAGGSVVLDEGSSGSFSGDLEVNVLYLPAEGNTATLASQTLEFNS